MKITEFQIFLSGPGKRIFGALTKMKPPEGWSKLKQKLGHLFLNSNYQEEAHEAAEALNLMKEMAEALDIAAKLASRGAWNRVGEETVLNALQKFKEWK